MISSHQTIVEVYDIIVYLVNTFPRYFFLLLFYREKSQKISKNSQIFISFVFKWQNVKQNPNVALFQLHMALRAQKKKLKSRKYFGVKRNVLNTQ